jgi:hypothetical protein
MLNYCCRAVRRDKAAIFGVEASKGGWRASTAPPVAVSEAQDRQLELVAISERIPLRDVGVGESTFADAPLAVSQSLSPCPQARCGPAARPV